VSYYSCSLNSLKMMPLNALRYLSRVGVKVGESAQAVDGRNSHKSAKPLFGGSIPPRASNNLQKRELIRDASRWPRTDREGRKRVEAPISGGQKGGHL
jgi:hypothetical protein